MNVNSIVNTAMGRPHLRRAGYWLVSASVAICALLMAVATPALAAPLKVHLLSCPNSAVTGYVGDFPSPGSVAGSMRQFLGIPYAAAPVGTKRWQPPQPRCWKGNISGNFFGKICPQGASAQPWMDEDCLSLNIFTQATGIVKNRPVMVYIHGGGLTSGSSSFFGQNPVDLVNKGVIVVTINYRLGAFGFLAHSALDNTATKNTGNYGILDQQAALKWVQDNISAFGGDPANVTIFGQSAGALSVVVHLLSPLSVGLFQKAISESAALGNTTLLADAEALGGATFAANVGCTSGGNLAKAKCLRGLSVDAILANQSVIGQSVGLIKVDGVVLTDSIKNLLTAGSFQKVPTIIGTNHDEQRFHLAGNSALGTGSSCNFTSNLAPNAETFFTGKVSYHNALVSQSAFGGTVGPQVETLYPGTADDLAANEGYTAALTDRNWACRNKRTANAIATQGGTVYKYEFNETNSPPFLTGPITLHDTTDFPYRAYHGAETQYIFPMAGTVGCGLTYPGLSPDQQTLAGAMVAYWTAFAKTGNPNKSALPRPPAWPLYTGPTGKLLSLVAGTPIQMNASAFDSDHKCSSFWDTTQP